MKRNDAAPAQSAGEGKRLLKIGEVAGRSGVSVETLRFYEKVGLLGKPDRSAGGYRLYQEDVLDRLTFVKLAQALGFSLDDISRVIAVKENGDSPCFEVREIVRERLRELDERLVQMQQYREELVRTLAEWDREGLREGRICGFIEESHLEHRPDFHTWDARKNQDETGHRKRSR